MMKQLEAQGEIRHYYFDGSGFDTTSSIPYAWQKVGTVCEIPCKRSARFNVLGFMSRDNVAYFHSVEGSVNSDAVIAAFDAFAKAYAVGYAKNQVPCVVTLDNASIHHSKGVKQRIAHWMEQGVFLHFLPPYSPELNLIEILWRKIKYEWLPIHCYKNFATMKQTILHIFENFGSQYTITFA